MENMKITTFYKYNLNVNEMGYIFEAVSFQQLWIYSVDLVTSK